MPTHVLIEVSYSLMIMVASTRLQFCSLKNVRSFKKSPTKVKVVDYEEVVKISIMQVIIHLIILLLIPADYTIFLVNFMFRDIIEFYSKNYSPHMQNENHQIIQEA